jgi:hypothetical protein
MTTAFGDLTDRLKTFRQAERISESEKEGKELPGELSALRTPQPKTPDQTVCNPLVWDLGWFQFENVSHSLWWLDEHRYIYFTHRRLRPWWVECAGVGRYGQLKEWWIESEFCWLIFGSNREICIPNTKNWRNYGYSSVNHTGRKAKTLFRERRFQSVEMRCLLANASLEHRFLGCCRAGIQLTLGGFPRARLMDFESTSHSDLSVEAWDYLLLSDSAFMRNEDVLWEIFSNLNLCYWCLRIGSKLLFSACLEARWFQMLQKLPWVLREMLLAVSGEAAVGFSNSFCYRCNNSPSILKVMLDRSRNISSDFILVGVADVAGAEREGPFGGRLMDRKR